MNYFFIINPNSGSNKNKSIIKNTLRKYPDLEKSFIYTEYPGHAARIAKQLIEKDVKNIVAVGGDGTVNEIASEMINTDVNLGIVPMGSGNGFARSLNLPLNPRQALDGIFKMYSIKVDVGKVNQRYFFAVAGVGMDATIAYSFQSSKKRGAFSYFIVGAKEYFNYSYPEFNITSNNETISVKPLIITVANANQFGNGALIAPHADLQDGLLDICIVNRMSLFKTVQAANKMFKGQIRKLSSYSTFNSKGLEISSQNENINYHVDGEPLKGTNKLVFTILPKALNVLVN